MGKLAVLGPQGTFSDIAAQKYMEGTERAMETVFYPTIDEAFHSVGGACGHGVIPIENSLDGYVQRTLDLLLEMEVHVLGEVSVPVRFALIANCQSREEIQKLYVQFKAAGQCRGFVSSLGDAAVVTTESNMISYHTVMEGKPGEAAVIPRHMLPEKWEGFLLENITDAADNETRFIVVQEGELGPLDLKPDSRIKASMYVIPEEDRPGILFDILREFYEQRVNLVSIMSRPTRLYMGSYNFYIEVDGAAQERDKILRVLIALKARHKVKLLGVYSI